MESGAPKVWSNGYASGGAQSGQSSREHLPDLSSSPRPAFGSPTAKKSSRFRLSSPQLDGPSPTTNKPAVTEGIRSNLSRRLDRMRKKPNTDVETSDVSRSALVASGSVTDLAWTPDVSEGEGLARSSPRVQSPVADQGKFRRSRMRKNGTDGAGKSVGIDSMDAPSGGEEGLKSRRGRFLAAAWQGFKVSLDTYPGGDGRLPAGPAALERRVRRRIIYADESDDEDIEVPREVLDLSDEEFLKFNGCVPLLLLAPVLMLTSSSSASFANFELRSLKPTPSCPASQPTSTSTSTRSRTTKPRRASPSASPSSTPSLVSPPRSSRSSPTAKSGTTPTPSPSILPAAPPTRSPSPPPTTRTTRSTSTANSSLQPGSAQALLGSESSRSTRDESQIRFLDRKSVV